MPTNTYVALATQTLGSAAASVTFSSIPATYTDLVLIASIKYISAGGFSKLTFNGDTATNYSTTLVLGNGSTTSSSRTSNEAFIAFGYDANTETFTDILNIQNYSNATTFKTVLNRHSVAGTRAEALVGLWRKTPETINSLTLTGGNNYAAGSTFSLYGIASQEAAAKATGGMVTSDANYYYHTFTASGTFTPKQSISADILVVAGGGSGGGGRAGGGGAGGLLVHTSQSLTATVYTCLVGAAASANSGNVNGNQGSNSLFGALTASVVGGFGASAFISVNGGNGGSGGGAPAGLTGGTATSGQGFAGGNGAATSNNYRGTGGGGGYGVDSGAGGSGICIIRYRFQ
jgi:hypothetical protein